MIVHFLAPAREEFLGAIEFYETEAPGLGAEFLKDVEHALQVIASTPRLGTPFEEDTRSLLFRRFPYRVIYKIEGDSILVVAVAHHRRKPGYWGDRLR